MQSALTGTLHAVATVSRPGRRPHGASQQCSSLTNRPSVARRAGRRASAAVRASAAARAGGIEAVGGVRPEIDAAIAAALDRCVTETDLGMGKKYKVCGGSWDGRA